MEYVYFPSLLCDKIYICSDIEKRQICLIAIPIGCWRPSEPPRLANVERWVKTILNGASIAIQSA